MSAALESFLQLRIVDVYLSRLDMFGPRPSPDEQATLQSPQAIVAAPFRWSPSR